MSASELELLESYIPSDNMDEREALAKAKDFMRSLDEIKANRRRAYSQYGFGVGGEPQDEIEEDRLPFTSYDP